MYKTGKELDYMCFPNWHNDNLCSAKTLALGNPGLKLHDRTFFNPGLLRAFNALMSTVTLPEAIKYMHIFRYV